MDWIAAGLLVWLAGTGMHWWPGPLAVTWRVTSVVMSRHRLRRSERNVTSWDTPDPDVTTSDVTPDLDHDREVAPGVLVSREPGRYGIGPRDLDELLEEAGLIDPDDPDEHLPDRRHWVAIQLAIRPPRPATAIDRDGAELYGVSERTILRDRQALTNTRRGTMGGPR